MDCLDEREEDFAAQVVFPGARLEVPGAGVVSPAEREGRLEAVGTLTAVNGFAVSRLKYVVRNPRLCT